MNEQQLREEFSARQYRWALQELQQELDHDFPITRRVKAGLVVQFMEFMESLPIEERKQCISNRIRCCYADVLKSTGDEVTEEEFKMRKSYSPKILIKSCCKSTEYQQILLTQGKAKAKTIKKCTKEALYPIFGKPYLVDGPNLGFRTILRGWLIDTYLFTGGKNQLDYMHVIKIAKQEEVRARPLLASDYLAMLSIAVTRWDLITEEDVPEAANTLAIMCSRFLEALPTLLEGLSPLDAGDLA